MTHLCVPQNQALGICRGFVPDIQICGTHGRKDLVNTTIISNAEEEELTKTKDYLTGKNSRRETKRQTEENDGKTTSKSGLTLNVILYYGKLTTVRSGGSCL